ncbi:MAG: threonine-phosphate decarboxylase CobD [Methanocellales archaeon]|nr:threonine-phosphate decarboxylase CobD [Methanocellales archaeon]
MRDLVRKEVLALERCPHGGATSNRVIDFSTSVNLLKLDVKDALLSAYERIDRYPDDQYTMFREAAASFVGVDAANIVPGNGSTEIIRLFAETIVERGDQVIIPRPTFGEYEFQSRLFGAEPMFIKFELVKDEQITDKMLEESKILYVCNPNNPTGDLLPQETLIELARRCSKNKAFLFVDETFIELSDPEQSIADIAAKKDFIFVLRSLTKCFAIPGVRIGYGVGPAQLIELLNRARLSWNVNTFADAIGTYLLHDPKTSKYLDRSRKLIKTEREWLTNQLSDIAGVLPLQSDANFILLDISGTDFSSGELTQRMLYHGILIRDCNSFKPLGRNYVRVAVRTREDNEKLVAALKIVIDPKARESCEHYPCHFEGQDCTFCFCPFYPCEDERLGKYVEKTTGGVAWSCVDCKIIHQAEVAQEILDRILAGDELRRIWKVIERRL